MHESHTYYLRSLDEQQSQGLGSAGVTSWTGFDCLEVVVCLADVQMHINLISRRVRLAKRGGHTVLHAHSLFYSKTGLTGGQRDVCVFTVLNQKKLRESGKPNKIT